MLAALILRFVAFKAVAAQGCGSSVGSAAVNQWIFAVHGSAGFRGSSLQHDWTAVKECVLCGCGSAGLRSSSFLRSCLFLCGLLEKLVCVYRNCLFFHVSNHQHGAAQGCGYGEFLRRCHAPRLKTRHACSCQAFSTQRSQANQHF